MPEGVSVDDLVSNIVGSISETIGKKKVSFADDEGSSSKVTRLFGRENPIHNVLGGGKSADVLLWRNKKISASFLTAATIVWVLFEWLNYHFLSLVFFIATIAMLIQFLWSNASGFMSKSQGSVPRLVLPEGLFENIGRNAGFQVNRVLQFVQDVSCHGNLKQFLMVVACMWVAAIIGSWCNFLTVAYAGIVAAHTLPVVYEKYEDQIDDFASKVFDQMRGQYRKIDSSLISKIPRGVVKVGKSE